MFMNQNKIFITNGIMSLKFAVVNLAKSAVLNTGEILD